MNQKLENIKSVFTAKESWIAFFLSSSLLALIMFRYTYFKATYYNIGAFYIYLQTMLQLTLAVLFGINVAMLLHKLGYSSQFQSKEAHTTAFSAVLGIIVSGCPACGITIASYLGLASFFASLPFFGMELKVIGILLLIYSIDSLAKNMYVCEVKVSKTL